MDYLSGLNAPQREAVLKTNGPLLILAGAGSGKTRTVTFRMAYMIDVQRINPKSILAVTFTNKAAAEMKERVKKILGPRKTRGLTISTFHSLAIRILREEIHHMGYSNDFTIYDTADQMSIIRSALKQFKAEKTFDKKTIMSKIGKLKNAGITAEGFKNTALYDPEDPYDEATEHVYHYYQDKLSFCNALDFDDILFLLGRLFESKPEVANKYSEKYQYIMVDEYQDTNELQFKMIKGLTSTHSNICVVGDDDQSIYAFRGADIKNILNFEKIYEDVKVIKLEQNYRSTSQILDLANFVIKKNTQRKDKTMFSTDDSGVRPLLWETHNSDHEAQIVLEEIVKHQMKGLHLSEVAILYRSNTQISPFEDQLRLNQVPYRIIGGQKFYEKKEIKDLIAYLSVIQNPKDELSLRRILNVPNRGIGTKSLKDFLEIGRETDQTLFQVIRKESQKDDNTKRTAALREFFSIIDSIRPLFSTMKLHQALQYLIEKLSYMDFVDKSYDSPKIRSRKKDDVRMFLVSTERFVDRFAEDATLKNYLDRLLLVDSHDSKDDNDGLLKNEVTLMTLHSSKGLEFEKVFMVGVEEELLPHKNTIKDGNDINEELRLLYVGITRAKQKLFMTHCKERKIYGKVLRRHKSRFLVDVPGNFMQSQDRTGFAHLSEEEESAYKKDFFANLLESLD